MSKVLVITTHFAPDIHVGAKRMTKFAKFLPSFGWQPVVLTKGISEYHGVDDTLLQEVSPHLPIHRVPEWRFGKSASLPEQATMQPPTTSGRPKTQLVRSTFLRAVDLFLFYDYSWLAPAFLTARRLIRRESIPVVYSSSPNHEAHLVALLLRMTSPVKWVCEFRDPWTILHPYYPSVLALQRMVDKQLERLVLRRSDHIVCVGEMLKAEMIRLGGIACHDKASVVYNGYDRDDFSGDNGPHTNEENKCVITYVGTWGPGRSPEHFLLALAGLIRRNPIVEEHLRVNLIGEFKYSPDLEKRVRALIEGQALTNVVSVIPWMPYKKALARMTASDILLLVERPESQTNDNYWVVTSKVFQYLCARRPILALIPSGSEAARIVREALGGEVVPPNDIDAIARKIGEMYDRWGRGQLATDVSHTYVDQYELRKQTGDLASIFDCLTSNIRARCG